MEKGPSPKAALICGVSGQDGPYLARLLLGKGYRVYGTSRDAQVSTFQNLVRLGIREQVQVESVSLTDFRSVWQVMMKIQPDEIYNLAGQSSVGLSFQLPVETLESITIGTLTMLEAIRMMGKPIRFYNAGSSECFGDLPGVAADETTPFHPRSPYAVAKAAAFWEVANYREAYGLYACTGILFNHESPLRPERFVCKKIIKAACEIAAGHADKLCLGNMAIRRDWGWAPEYVEAMWLMLQQDQPADFVIATGESQKLEDFVSLTFSSLGLNWQNFVHSDPQLSRPTDLSEGRGCSRKAWEILGWKAQAMMPDVVRMMVKAEMDEDYHL
ncbi:GDP-mannose 4,6-dehydratase [Candidatus Nitrospira salsa]|nr:MAG: GDP-mannose 4,6-dehydratase [Nitrospirales bacterium]